MASSLLIHSPHDLIKPISFNTGALARWPEAVVAVGSALTVFFVYHLETTDEQIAFVGKGLLVTLFLRWKVRVTGRKPSKRFRCLLLLLATGLSPGVNDVDVEVVSAQQ